MFTRGYHDKIENAVLYVLTLVSFFTGGYLCLLPALPALVLIIRGIMARREIAKIAWAIINAIKSVSEF